MTAYTATHTRTDCNWMIKETAELRAQVMADQLQGVQGLEARLAIKIAVRDLSHDELLILAAVEGATPQDARDYLEQFGNRKRAIQILRDDLGHNETH